MVAPTDTGQRIARLTPLAEVLARIDAAVQPFKPYRISPREAILRQVKLAADVVAPQDCPAFATALIDGFAVDSGSTLDAGAYTPVLMTKQHRVAVGEKLPPGCDAVASLDAVQVSGNAAAILVPIAAGTGVLQVGADAADGTVLRRAGEFVRRSDLAVLQAVGIEAVQACMPHVRVIETRDSDIIVNAVALMILDFVEQCGGLASRSEDELEAALAAGNTEFLIVIGGTGAGPQDNSVRTLARVGRVEVHGIALTPGETAAFGMIGDRPVLLIPGRIDAAIAVFATLGVHILARLMNAKAEDRSEAVTLSRKITSTIGLAEFIPLRRDGDSVTPLGAGYLPMQALARADGWLLVPPDSEGYPAGTIVRMRAWP